MPTRPPVEVQGLADLRKALGKISKDLQKELTAGLKAIAEHFVPTVDVPVRSGKLKASLRPRATARSASVALGAPYGGFVEFGNAPHRGGGVGRGDSQPREYVAKGRYIFPAAERQHDSIERQIEDLVDRLIEKAGLA